MINVKFVKQPNYNDESKALRTELPIDAVVRYL